MNLPASVANGLVAKSLWIRDTAAKIVTHRDVKPGDAWAFAEYLWDRCRKQEAATLASLKRT